MGAKKSYTCLACKKKTKKPTIIGDIFFCPSCYEKFLGDLAKEGKHGLGYMQGKGAA